MSSPFRARTPCFAREVPPSCTAPAAPASPLSAPGQGRAPASDEQYVHPPAVTSRTDRRSRCSLWTPRDSKLFGGLAPRASARVIACATVACRASFRAALSWTTDASATAFAAATCSVRVVVKDGVWCSLILCTVWRCLSTQSFEEQTSLGNDYCRGGCHCAALPSVNIKYSPVRPALWYGLRLKGKRPGVETIKHLVSRFQYDWLLFLWWSLLLWLLLWLRLWLRLRLWLLFRRLLDTKDTHRQYGLLHVWIVVPAHPRVCLHACMYRSSCKQGVVLSSHRLPSFVAPFWSCT